jgi:diaminopimelate decarboxylase
MTKLNTTERARLLSVAKKFGTPLYVYDAALISAQCEKLKRNFKDTSFHYAMKANSNPQILSLIKKAGLGVEAVSIGELELALSVGFAASRISFTCSSLTEAELVHIAKTGVRVHLDSLHQLEIWGAKKLGTTASIRLNQGIGGGHHAHVITGGPDSKFGIVLRDVPKAKTLAKKYGVSITGIQQHIGSNVLDIKIFEKAVRVLLETAKSFPDVAHIDFGGGIGVAYAPGVSSLPLGELGKRMRSLTGSFQREVGRTVAFSMEPGRFLVAEAGTLLVSVTDIKSTEKHHFVGVNSGFNQLIRPAMYGSYHPIENLTRARGPRKSVTVAGNVCESGDIFASKRLMVAPQIGDTLAMLIAGAYGFTMASNYNLRKLPREVLLTLSGAKDISFVPSTHAR